MNKEIEEAIKRLKILECDCIYFENGKCTYNKNKCQREQDIETVLKHIKNSIPKERIEKIVEELRKEYELLLEHQSGQESNRTKYLKEKIHMCQEFLKKK